MKKNKSFRKSILGGFNTRDVVDYLAQISKERREEAEALRAGADKLRRERDDALEKYKTAPIQQDGARQDETLRSLLEERDRLAAQAEALRAELDRARIDAALPAKNSSAADYEELRLQYYEMRKDRDELLARLGEEQAAHRAEREERERFMRERNAFEGDRDSVLTALTARDREKAELVNERASWLKERGKLVGERQELLAEREGLIGKIASLNAELADMTRRFREIADEAGRAEAIREQADNVKKETARLITETRARFNEVISGGKGSALEVVLELDRMRIFLARFTEYFASVEQSIKALEEDPRPHIREFSPEIFDRAISTEGGIE